MKGQEEVGVGSGSYSRRERETEMALMEVARDTVTESISLCHLRGPIEETLLGRIRMPHIHHLGNSFSSAISRGFFFFF